MRTSMLAVVVMAPCLALTIHGCGGGGGGGGGDSSGGTTQLRSPESVEIEETQSASWPQVALDSRGNGMVVWEQSNGVGYNLWGNRYTVGSGWGTPLQIATAEVGKTFSLAMDPSGNAIVVWHQSNGVADDIWSNRHVAGVGWGTAEKIETDDVNNADSPQIAADSNGNAIAVWGQSNGAVDDIWANRYVAGVGWGTAEKIETDDVNYPDWPQIAMDSNGNAIAVWCKSNGGITYNVWANRYVAGVGWGTAQQIETDPAGKTVEIAMDSNGNAIAVWGQSNGAADDIWASRYVAGVGWGTAEKIETDDVNNAQSPRIAMDSRGNAIVVWCPFNGAAFTIWANRYVSGTGWGTPEEIVMDPIGKTVEIAMDSNGNAIAVWSQSNGAADDIWFKRYSAGAGWGTSGKIEADDVLDAQSPRVSMTSGGKANVVWSLYGTAGHIWSARFD